MDNLDKNFHNLSIAMTVFLLIMVIYQSLTNDSYTIRIVITVISCLIALIGFRFWKS